MLNTRNRNLKYSSKITAESKITAGLNVRKQKKKKNLWLIEFSDPLLNSPSSGLLGSSVNTTTSIYVVLHWQEKTFVDV